MAGSEAHIEQMQRQLEAMASREQLLIQALSEALEAADRRLLDDVRHVTIEHENRRTVIMTELQSLAERIGVFPKSAPPVQTIEYEVPAAEEAEVVAAGVEAEKPKEGGDWRKAAEKIGKELDFYISRSGTSRSAAASSG